MLAALPEVLPFITYTVVSVVFNILNWPFSGSWSAIDPDKTPPEVGDVVNPARSNDEVNGLFKLGPSENEYIDWDSPVPAFTEIFIITRYTPPLPIVK